ncbi:hypothetical protein SSBR45G_58890 [Bradyrhizobium sp. SSBR45G]|uniref:hypothetical protein n=1 Tax=unclassified Bradyrhizobium TaxID=2631580 RepID=UPI002342BCF9|nr:MULTISPECIES: hypothetical protein [unclassified Bradyrhizobium]GLH80980.1 hypothetical protein SSBR45G_58890 [Bradyrhizobium sp. SSBR45G]GLH88452.1 hypothetical protein SSBR45R_59130 [Bradyrhizobium sp. SSBR45R]
MIIRHPLVPFAVAAVLLSAGHALAQSAFPAPLPGQTQSNASPFPPINGNAPAPMAAPANAFPPAAGPAAFGGGGGGFAPPQQQAGPSDSCMKDFVPLREEAERRGKLIQEASKKKATPVEACKLFRNFSQAEIKMIKYVEANSARCGIPGQIAEQLKTNHKGTEGIQQKVCNVAEQMQKGGSPAQPGLSDVLGTSAALPEANTGKKGGSTFDSLTGNPLTR